LPRHNKTLGLPVITMTEGKKVGRVDGLLIDPDQKRIRWLRMRRGMLSTESFWVPAEAVHAVGEHAVTINGESDPQTPTNASEAQVLVRARRRLVGSKAVTESGEYVGEVRDYEFAPDTFALTQIYLPAGRFSRLRTVPASQVLTIGRDVTILAANALQSTEAAPAEHREAEQATQEPPTPSAQAQESSDHAQEPSSPPPSEAQVTWSVLGRAHPSLRH
jgi:uncharacterized protein YrrD